MKTLQYRGPGRTFDASARPGAKKGLIFERNGEPIPVSNALAEDLLTYPGNSFIDVTPAEPAQEETEGDGTSTE